MTDLGHNSVLDMYHSFTSAHTVYFTSVTHATDPEENSIPLSITVAIESIITFLVEARLSFAPFPSPFLGLPPVLSGLLCAPNLASFHAPRSRTSVPHPRRHAFCMCCRTVRRVHARCLPQAKRRLCARAELAYHPGASSWRGRRRTRCGVYDFLPGTHVLDVQSALVSISLCALIS